MPKILSHEEIAERFVHAKVIDFTALGKLITELGPQLAVSDQGWHGVTFGKYHTLACMMPAADLTRVVGDLRAASATTAALEGAANLSLPR